MPESHSIGPDKGPTRLRFGYYGARYKLKFGEHKLLELLQKRFTAAEISIAQRIVATQAWHRIYTTNYDNVLRTAFSQERKRAEFVGISERIRPVLGTMIVSLNGDISKATIRNLESEIKLTRASYMTDTFLDTQWHSFFKTDLSLATAVVFFGYSMYDIDVARIVYRDPLLKQKTYFIETQDLDDAYKRELEQFGTVLTIGVEAFADQLVRVPARAAPVMRLTSIVEETLPETASSATGDAVLSLVMQGDVRDEVILGARSVGPVYIVPREAVSRVEGSIRDGVKRFVVHSDLGNGKTILIHDLKLRLLQSPFKVFTSTQYDSMIDDDLRYISRFDGPTVFLIEDFFRNVEAIEKIVHMFPDEVIVCTARTSIFDLRHEQVSRVLGSDYKEFDVNRLEPSDIKSLIEIVDQNGLWGEFSGKSLQEKAKFVQTTCDAEMRVFLIKLFESPMFKDRLIKYFYSDLNNRLLKWLTAIFFLDIAEIPPDTMIASEVSCIDIFTELHMLRTSSAREFVDIGSGRIKVKSSILGQYILQHVFEPEFVLNILISCAKNCDAARYGNEIFYTVLKEISKFSFVDRIFLRSRAKDHYIRLYDELKMLASMERNPQFWLQYAIARLSNGDYRASEILFETSYAHAKSRTGYDTFQIDNHYARFLLESRANDVTFGDPFRAFLNAHKLLLGQAKKEKDAYFPYKVAGGYRPFYQKREREFTFEQKKIILQAAGDIIREIDAGSSRLLRYGAVVEARESLSILIAESKIQDPISNIRVRQK